MKQKKGSLSAQAKIDRYCRAIRSGMEEGHSLDGALLVNGLLKSFYNRICRKKAVIEALIDGESKRKAYWETKMKEASRQSLKLCNPAVIIKMYESCCKEYMDDDSATVPKVMVFGIESKKEKKTLKKRKTTIVETEIQGQI